MDELPAPPAPGTATEKLARWRSQHEESRDCGDWLAERLHALTTYTDIKNGRKRVYTDVRLLDDLLELNGVRREGSWATLPERQPRNWRGLYRMAARNVLARYVRFRRGLYTPAGFEPAPRGWT